MNNLDPRYMHALETFIAPFKKDKNVIGILVTGSVIHSVPDKNSDLDVQIVLRTSAWRERGNTWIDGVEVEYFLNPVSQIRAYFKNEREKHTAHMFTNCVLLYDTDGTMKKLLSEAREIMKRKLPRLKKVQRENAKYSLDDSRKDLEDIYLRNDSFAFTLQTAEAIDECLNVFFKVNRISSEKSKRLEDYVKKIDPQFGKLLKSAVIEKDTKKQYKYVCNLIAYTEKLLGGAREREWKLRGPLDI